MIENFKNYSFLDWWEKSLLGMSVTGRIINPNFIMFMKNYDNVSGCYVFCTDKGAPLYVGKSKNLRKRVPCSFRENVLGRVGDMKELISVGEVNPVVIIFEPKNAAEYTSLEYYLIGHLNPIINAGGEGKKKYPYVEHKVRGQAGIFLNRSEYNTEIN